MELRYEPTGTTIAEKALSKSNKSSLGLLERASKKALSTGKRRHRFKETCQAIMKMKDVKKFASTKHKGLQKGKIRRMNESNCTEKVINTVRG